jgi:hypothetical protein
VDIRTTDLYGTYTTNTGTSLAASHVAGGLALLLSAYPDLAAADQEGVLINSAVDLGTSGLDDVYGYGRLDLLAALNWLVNNPPSAPAPSATPTTTPITTPTLPPTGTSTPTPVATMHIGDLDGSTTSSRSKWDATVTILVYDAIENPVANANVSGVWSSGASGTDPCITNGSGVCQISKIGLNSKTKSVAFTVNNVTQTTPSYDPTSNHDPDGDSDGTTLTISKP